MSRVIARLLLPNYVVAAQTVSGSAQVEVRMTHDTGVEIFHLRNYLTR